MLKLSLAVLIAYVVVIAVYWLLQDRYIFYPPPPSEGKPNVPPGHHFDELALVMSDGTRLEGWLIMPPTTKPPLLMYFGGNAEEASSRTALAGGYQGYAVLFVNYRGYGRSQGKPSEQALFSDAIEIYDQVTKRADIDGEKVILQGSSMGSGVAVFLASQRQVVAVILTSPYDSIRAMGKDMFPYLPVSLILRHPFDSISRAPQIKVPLLCLATEQDEVIPITRSRRLCDAWGGKQVWREIANAGHNTISDGPDYWLAVSEFLRSYRD